MKQLLLILILFFPSIGYADISTGLIAWWKLDEGSGITTADSSGNNNTGTLSAGTSWSDGEISKAIQFDGSSGNVSMSSAIDLTNSGTFTLSAWVYPTSLTSQSDGGGIGGTILDSNEDGSGNGWAWGVDNNNNVWWWPDGGGDTFSNGTIPLNTWTLITLTYDGSNLSMYLNGDLDSVTPSDPPQGSPQFLNIGAQCWITGWWAGALDDIRIYDRALSDSDVAQLYKFNGDSSGQFFGLMSE